MIPMKADKRRQKHLWDAFRITLDEWKTIFEYQGQVCAICKKTSKYWHVDHNHKTGLVRGILCSQCNRALGKCEDPRWKWSYRELYRASLYLDNPPAINALGRQVHGFPGKIGTERYRKWLKKADRIEATIDTNGYKNKI